MKHVLFRSIFAYGLAITTSVVAHLYFSSDLYSGPVTATEPQGSIFGFLVTIFILVVLKLAIYDLIGSALLKKSKTSFSKSIFYGGYSLALAIDLFSIFMALRPIYMNLAIFGTIVYSAPVLLLASILLIGGWLLTRRKS